MQGRLNNLYYNANAIPTSPDILPTAFKELGHAAEELQIALEELTQTSEELATAKLLIEDELHRYQDLFEFAPDAYLVTDNEGVIQEANRNTSILFNILPRLLIGKPFYVLVAPAERQKFLTKLIQIRSTDVLTELTVNLQRRDRQPFSADIRVATVRDCEGKQVALRWLIRDATKTQQPAAATETVDDLEQERPLQTYAKGEIISLPPDAIAYVRQGLVKLSAYCERGAEILVGLVGPENLFGVELTSLQTYQATALADVKLALIPFAEITASAKLCQTMLPRLNQRQRQTELLLFVAGQRRVKDRLRYLLQFLKQEIGQPVVNGTRLSVRLTHEDLASACGTTRVTVTRELGKLQQQGLITIDSRYHIVLQGGKDWQFFEPDKLLQVNSVLSKKAI